MRRVLPGGATLDGDDERRVACRPCAAVMVRTHRKNPIERLLSGVMKLPGRFITFMGSFSTSIWQFLSSEHLTKVNVLLSVLTALVGLITALLALLGWFRK